MENRLEWANKEMSRSPKRKPWGPMGPWQHRLEMATNQAQRDGTAGRAAWGTRPLQNTPLSDTSESPSFPVWGIAMDNGIFVPDMSKFPWPNSGVQDVAIQIAHIWSTL